MFWLKLNISLLDRQAAIHSNVNLLHLIYLLKPGQDMTGDVCVCVLCVCVVLSLTGVLYHHPGNAEEHPSLFRPGDDSNCCYSVCERCKRSSCPSKTDRIAVVSEHGL